jgi:hypothetical protein
VRAVSLSSEGVRTEADVVGNAKGSRAGRDGEPGGEVGTDGMGTDSRSCSLADTGTTDSPSPSRALADTGTTAS